MSKPILTLTVNPAIDRIVTVDRLVFEDRAYIETSTEAAGGRGINAARVLTSFGASVVAITTSGARTGSRRFEEALQADEFGKDIVKIRQPIRTNLTITDRRGLTLKLNELGPKLSQAEQNRIISAVTAHLPSASWLMLCGSLPPSVDGHFYVKLIRAAAKHEVKTLLDTDGDALLHGIEAKPTLVKPNHSEAERLLNTPLITRPQLVDAVRRIKDIGAETVALSLGSRGIVAATNDGSVLEVVPPSIEAVSPIGAGDAAAAAIVWSLARGDSFSEALRWGVAAGTASTELPGITLANLEQTQTLYKQTSVTRLA
ncbi:MAG TPA: hexose kinase [Bryobacteraceae bacterium]|jgi:1-phosphofructokinase family hexose kinase|nr:hexose kinase [Bryobacteraceae bacterium]